MKGPAECIDHFKGKLNSLKLIATGTRHSFVVLNLHLHLFPLYTAGETLNKDARDWFLDKVGQFKIHISITIILIV